MAHVFFFSYATADATNGNGAVEWFFTAVAGELQIVHGAKRVDQGGFMAPVSIEPGEKWSRGALPQALNTTSVLVALQSPNYFESEFCGREFEVFLRRRRQFAEQSGGEPPDCVIPVLWQPVYDAPAGVPDFQWKQLDGSRFPVEAEGLYQAYIGGRLPELRQFAHQLAQRISILLRKNVEANGLPPLAVAPDIHGIRSAFSTPDLPLPDFEYVKGAGPRSATFVYPDAMSRELKPFGPPLEKAAVSRAAAIARSREMAVQGIAFNSAGDGLVARIERAQQLNSSVVLILTGASLDNARLLSTFESIRPEGIATILVDGTSHDGDRIPGPLVGSLRANDLFHAGLKGADDLDRAIKSSLGALHNRLAQAGNLSIARPTPHTTLPQA